MSSASTHFSHLERMIHRTSPLTLARGLLAAGLLALVAPLHATSFTISTNSSTARTLVSGETGTVNAGKSLSVGGSTADVTLSGGTVVTPTTLTNNGTIQQTGSGRAVQQLTGSTNAVLVINNNAGAVISTANNDTVAAGTGSGTTVTSVSLINAGTIQSAAGGQAVNFNKITSGANSVVNSGLIKAVGSDAVRPGVNGTVTNSGTILSTQVAGSGSDGIDVQNNTGVVVTNNTGGLIEGGRHGITGGAATSAVTFTTTVTNNAGATIQGDNGSGLNLDGFNANQTATVVNHGLITGNGVTGDGDGIDSDGLINLTNTGVIRSINAFSSTTPAQSEGISVGGGTITNSGTIEGLVAAGNLNAVGRGISLLGNDITTGALAGTREAIYGNATVTNLAGGLIRGDSDSAIAVDGPASGFTVTIDNQAGATLRGGGTVNAALRTGADNDVVTNGGLIDGSSGGKAIDLGGGNDGLTITGGSAVVHGGMDGGAGTDSLTFNLGAPTNTFTQNGAITHFEHIEVASGNVQLSGGFDLGAAANTLAVDNGAILNVGAGSLTLNQGSVVTDGILKFLLNSSSSYGQMFFAAGNLGGLTLTGTSVLDLDFGYSPLVGEHFTLVDFLGGSPFLAGTFAGLAEGASFLQDGYQFRITYKGNGGHDIVVTRTVPDAGATLAFLAIGLGLLVISRRIHGIGLRG